ncbi:MAG: hypothetical protein AAF242_01455 [Bacteroidota bacterium]
MKNLALLIITLILSYSCTSFSSSNIYNYGTENEEARTYFLQGWEEIMDNGRWTESELAFRKAVELDPDWLLGKSLLGRITRDSEERREILADLEARKDQADADERLLLDVNLLSIQAANNRDLGIKNSKAFNEQRFQLAEKNFGQFARKYPRDAYFKAEYIEFLHHNHGAQIALDSLHKLATKSQKQLGFYQSYAATLELELGNIEQAKALCNQLEESLSDPSYTSPLMCKVGIYMAEGDYPAAKQLIDQVVQMDSNHLIALGTQQGIDAQLALSQINTVQGAVSTTDLGFTLTHEHIMSNYGKDISEASIYDTSQLFQQVIPYLRQLKAQGMETIVDCTTEYFGRRVDLLEKIADASGVQLLTNTGIYGAAGDRYIPDFAYRASVDSLARIWIEEFEYGIKDTGIKPGFIKLAFDDGEPPSPIDQKLFEAGLIAHLKTGLTLAVHTGANLEAVAAQMKLMEQYQVDPSAWIWTHANKLKDDTLLAEYAAKGAWISLDGVKEENIEEYIQRLQFYKKRNLLQKVLVAHDGNGFPNGGEIRNFDAIPKYLLPAMLENGFSEADIQQIFHQNPQEVFKVRVRRSQN